MFKIGPSSVLALPFGIAGRTKWQLLTALFSPPPPLSQVFTFLPKGLFQGYDILHGLLSQKKIRILDKQKCQGPLFLPHHAMFGFSKVVL